MKEVSFVQQNSKKWEELEAELVKTNKDPEKLSRLFLQVTDDLSFAQSFYQNRSVKVYLNGLSQLLFTNVYRSSQLKLKSITDFWIYHLPLLIYKARREFLISFLFFTVALLIGVLSSHFDPQFTRQILGDSYVDMTLKNINNNDPMAVYKSGAGFDMFLGITLNNLMVAFRTFILGLFLGIGTLISLLTNGVMVGSFQYFFIQHNLLGTSFLTIWQHGTLEISSIIIAGAAGLTMSYGLLFPGTYTRVQALQISARSGLKIMLGITPIIIMAALIEGFFTRITDAPVIVRVMVILFSLAFILLYFVFYPRAVVKKYPEKIDLADKLGYLDRKLPDISGILNHDQLFGNTLKVFRTYIGKILSLWFMLSIVASLVITFFAQTLVNLSEGILQTTSGFGVFVNYATNPLMFFINSLAFSFILLLSAVVAQKAYVGSVRFKIKESLNAKRILNSVSLSFVLNALYFLPLGWAIFIVLLIFPMVILAFFYGYDQKKWWPAMGLQTIKLQGKSFGLLLLLYLKFVFISMLIILLIRPNNYSNLLNAIQWNIGEEQGIVHLFDLIISFIFYFFHGIILFCLALAINIYYYTASEIQFAGNLIHRISYIGQAKTVKGYTFE